MFKFIVFTLYDKLLPYVVESKHLGHLINTDESMDHDLLLKRREFIGKFNSLRQELGQQDPYVYLRLIKTYLLHLYGSPLWHLSGAGVEKLWCTWHVLLRSLFSLPLATHRYILEGISSTEHLKVTVLKRFSKFHDKLVISNNPLIRNLYSIQCGDMRSSLGRNIHELAVNTSYRSNIPIHPVPPGEEWRVQLVRELLAVREDVVTVDGLMPLDIEAILQQVCCY